jgi:hypothetical protein
MRITTITRYEAVKLTTRKRFRSCRVCGKPGTRSKTFRQTINPFNKNPSGQPKTRREIWQELQAAAAVWAPDTHSACDRL